MTNPLDPGELELKMDDLIMRMKDCISHEDNHGQQFGDRCITRVQFKQQMKAIFAHHQKQAEIEGRFKELKYLFDRGWLTFGMIQDGEYDARLIELKQERDEL